MIVIGLMLMNWGIEARKWQVLIQSIERISLLKCFKAVLSGQSFALNTPNGTGEFVGRVLFLSEGNRIKGAALTLVGSMAQLTVTLTMGSIGLWLMKWKWLSTQLSLQQLSGVWLNSLISIVFAVTAVAWFCYFKISLIVRVIEKIPFIAKFTDLIKKVEELSFVQLARIMSLSFTRFFVFILQYYLLFQLFKVAIPFHWVLILISVKFLILAFIPSIALADVGLRGEMGIQLIGLVSTNTLGIIATSTAIWLINLILPALAGSLFILGIRIFRNEQHG